MVKILFPPVILVLLIAILSASDVLKELGLLYYPISFGLVIGITNFNRIRFKVQPVILKISFSAGLSILVSLIAFVIGYYSLAIYGVFEEDLQQLFGEDRSKIVTITFGTCVVATLALFVLYQFVFKLKSGRFGFYVKLSAIVLLVIYYFLFFEHFKTKETINEIFYPNTIWQGIMALALQLLFFQKRNQKERVGA
ncbi:hypothetical protein [Aestuariivivens sediminis]|uniref:hypothetical protein n=1 Tax=Aestuariivivens sediminis TaxID=2913557 RepID=UPI001F55D762|nr:hypothetical protein [Aestuariivivens sediminis]